MLSNEQQQLLARLEGALSRDQLLWAAGYLAGRAGGAPAAAENSTATAMSKLTVFFATETGNSKMVAQQLLKPAKAAGWKAQAKPVSRVTVADLQALEGPAVFVAATHGEGDPPETAVSFYDQLKAAPGGALETLSFITLGLGDTSYAEFCGFARKLDTELERLGASALMPRREFDVDFAQHVPEWIESTLKHLHLQPGAKAREDSGTPALSLSLEQGEATIKSGKGYSRLEPVTGTVTEIVNLNDTGSRKETFHIEIAYDDELSYQPGDAAGIIMPQAEEGVDMITPRLYSVASSPEAHGQSIHLTVAHAWHRQEDGGIGYGLCSHYLAGLQPGDEIRFYIHQNHQFRLAPDGRDMIMIGPGTGIAPFRSFVWERAERGDAGRNWLFFGEQHAHCDFLYQLEWQDHLQAGNLEAIDLAFSRDQANKVYVQDRLRARGDTLCDWLEGGAHLYLCGNKDPMSHDVETALVDIIAARKGESARDYLADLADEGRYVKDVY